MPEFDRPRNTDFLIQATYRLFGEACLRCGVRRPLEMAHIRNWPDCVALAGAESGGMKPSRDWQLAVAVDIFHSISNVVPLCPNCHTLFDQPRYSDVTERSILELRDAAVKRIEVLKHVIDFVCTELSGRPNRCLHSAEDGGREHTHMIDEHAAAMALSWVVDAYRERILTDDPHVMVGTNDGWHYHVRFDCGSIRYCSGSPDECGGDARTWIPARSRRARQPSGT